MRNYVTFWGREREKKVWVNQSHQWPQLEAPSLPAGPGLSWLEQGPSSLFPHWRGIWNMSTISKEIRGREMRTPGDLERLTAGEGQRALGSTACAQPWLCHLFPDIFCWKIPRNYDNKVWWVPRSQASFRSVSMWWHQPRNTCKMKLCHWEQYHGQSRLCMITNDLGEIVATLAKSPPRSRTW